MKIIYKGVDPSTKPMIGTCTKCKTQVEFTEEEATYMSSFRGSLGDYYVSCPVCSNMIWSQK